MSGVGCARLLVAGLLSAAAWGAQPSGAELLGQALTREAQLPAFSALITNTLGADASQVVRCRYWRRRGATPQVRVALLPDSQGTAADPAAATKVFIFTDGHCYFSFRGRSVAVDPGLVPTYGIADFIIPVAPDQVFSVAATVLAGLPCTHLTQTIAADPATKAEAIVLDYAIDQASGLIVQVVRHDGAALSYEVVRSELVLDPATVTDALFAVPPALRPGLISDMAALTAVFIHGIP